MISIHNKLKESDLKASMILQVHDELIFEVAESYKEAVRDLVVKEMENACKLDVPLVVEHGFGKNWLEAH